MGLRRVYPGTVDHKASKHCGKKNRICRPHASYRLVFLSWFLLCSHAGWTRGKSVGSGPHINEQPESARVSQGEPWLHTKQSEQSAQFAKQSMPLEGEDPAKSHGIQGPTGESWGRNLEHVRREQFMVRRLLQASGSSGSCHYVVVGGTTQSTITTAVCATTTFGSTEPFAACCTPQCQNGPGSLALCSCTGYSDTAVTCSGSQPLAGCCAKAGGGAQGINPPDPSTPVTTSAPTVPPMVAPTLPPSPVATTGAPVVPPPLLVPTGVPTGAPSSQSPPPSSQNQLVAPPGAPSSSKSGGGSNAKTAVAVAGPLFAFLATAVVWAAFAYRYRTKKEAIVRRTILLCTDRDPTPTLPNPGQYRQELVEANLRKMLTSVLAKWDSWNGCSQKTTFPSRGEFGVWKQRFYRKEAEVLLAALLDVDAGFGSQDGYEGVLDRWQQEPASQSYMVAKLCEFVEETGEDWSKPVAIRMADL